MTFGQNASVLASFAVVGDAEVSAEVAITVFVDTTDPQFRTAAHTITFAASSVKAFNLRPAAGGSLFLRMRLYNRGRSDAVAPYTEGDLDLTPIARVITTENPDWSATVKHTIRTSVAIWRGTVATSVTADFLMVETDFAAYGFAFNNTAQLFHHGAGTPAAAVSLFSAYGLSAAYQIPQHAVKGVLIRKDNIHSSRFLSNPQAGTLEMNFGTGIAELDLTVKGYGSNSWGSELLQADWSNFPLTNTIAFVDFQLPNLAGSSADNRTCPSADRTATPNSAKCGGTFTHHFGDASSKTDIGNNTAAAANAGLDINIGFYGGHAQQIAGYARYATANMLMQFAFFGLHNINHGGLNPAQVKHTLAAPHTALRWDRANPLLAGRSHIVTVNSSGAPVSYTTPSLTTAFGAAAGTEHSYHYFRENVGALLSAHAGVMRVSNYALPAENVVYSGEGPDGGDLVFSVTAKAYRSVVGTITTFSQVVGAEHAAFFFMYGRDIRTAQHGVYGARTPQWRVDQLRAISLNALHVIAVGAAQGYFWNHTGTDAATHREFFLYNAQAGELEADFFSGNVRILDLTVGSVDKDGRYTEDFLKIAGFGMTIVGDTFNKSPLPPRQRHQQHRLHRHLRLRRLRRQRRGDHPQQRHGGLRLRPRHCRRRLLWRSGGGTRRRHRPPLWRPKQRRHAPAVARR